MHPEGSKLRLSKKGYKQFKKFINMKKIGENRKPTILFCMVAVACRVESIGVLREPKIQLNQ